MRGLLIFIGGYLLIISLWTGVYGIKYYEVLDEVYSKKFKQSEPTVSLNQEQQTRESVRYYLPLEAQQWSSESRYETESVALISSDLTFITVNKNKVVELIKGVRREDVLSNSTMIVFTDELISKEVLNNFKEMGGCGVLSKLKDQSKLEVTQAGLAYFSEKSLISSLMVTIDGDCDSSGVLRIEVDLQDDYAFEFLRKLLLTLGEESWHDMLDYMNEVKRGTFYVHDLCVEFVKDDYTVVISLSY